MNAVVLGKGSVFSDLEFALCGLKYSKRVIGKTFGYASSRILLVRVVCCKAVVCGF